MTLRFPVRRFVQSTEKIRAPRSRLGSAQWVLARPLYRFHVIDLAQVPTKSRPQALRLELNQWTPFRNPGYYTGWSGHQALVWAWDAEKTHAAMVSQNLKPDRVEVLPESLLHSPLQSGPCLVRCVEGYEGQLWRSGSLQNSRWWPQAPGTQEWLLFQRDAGLPPEEQMNEAPVPRDGFLNARPWLAPSGLQDTTQAGELLVYAALALALLAPTLWFGSQWYKTNDAIAQLAIQLQQLQTEATPIAQARAQALDHQRRINALIKLAPYPDQLSLMAKLAQVLPSDKTILKDWDFQSGQLKFTLISPADISATTIITLLQQAGPFLEVKAMPGRDPKAVTFQMNVAPTGAKPT